MSRVLVAWLGAFGLVWGAWFGTALVGLWVYPVGFTAYAGQITSVTTCLALAACVVVGARMRSSTAPAVTFLGAVAGLASAWALTVVLDRRESGDAMEIAWFLSGCMAAVAAAVGVLAGQLVDQRRATL